MKYRKGTVENSVFAVVGVAVIIGSVMLDNNGSLALSPGLFPLLLGCLILVISLLMMRRDRKESVSQENAGSDEKHAGKKWLKVLAFVGMTLLYIPAMQHLHFIIATVLYVCVAMLLLGERRWWALVFFPVAISLVIFYGFDKGLQVYLP